MFNNPCTECGVDRWQLYKSRAARLKPLCHICTKRKTGLANKRHGLEKHPLYRTWSNMRRRCNPTRAVGREIKAYVGIAICPEWHDVVTFIEWAKTAGWERGLSIERIDNARGYSPDNCTFIPHKMQSRNRSIVKMTPEIIQEIKARLASGEAPKEIVKDMVKTTGLHRSTLVNVAYGRAWQ